MRRLLLLKSFKAFLRDVRVIYKQLWERNTYLDYKIVKTYKAVEKHVRYKILCFQLTSIDFRIIDRINESLLTKIQNCKTSSVFYVDQR